MKKLSTITALLIIGTFSVTMTLFANAALTSAAVGIPDYLRPNNVGLKDLNEAITKNSQNSTNTANSSQQDAAVQNINIVLQYVANLLLFFAAPLAVMFIARAGGDYAMAFGDESKVEGAKRQLTYALLGLVLIMTSYVITRFLFQPFPVIQGGNDKALGGATTSQGPSTTSAGGASTTDGAGQTPATPAGK